MGENMRYKFRYLNGIYKLIAFVAGPMQNFSIIIGAFLLIYYLISKIIIAIGIDDSFIDNSLFREMMFTCAIIFASMYYIFKKGVFLYNDKLIIARYTITLTNWNPYIVIKYSDIESVNVNYSDIHFTKYRLSFITLCGDESYNVELTLKNGKKYFFSIQNQEAFCNNLSQLINNYKN